MAFRTPHLTTEGHLPALSGASAWLNSPPLTPEGLRGRPVVVQFWTYTCINWLRTLPAVRAWAARYRDQGLVVIGVHSPEFPFERDLDNVRWAVREMAIEHPVAVDPDHAVWNAFANHYWPALYLVDARGVIRHRHFGEGDEARSERVVQRLLEESGAPGVPHEPVAVHGEGIEAAADWADLRSAEEYLGHERAERFASPGGARADERHDYSPADRLHRDEWSLAGTWTVHGQGVELHEAGGRISHRFHARDLHLVMGPTSRGASPRFRVLLDGQPPGAAHGLDVDEQGLGRLDGQRLHQLVRQPLPITDRQFDIEFLDPGVEAFVFTFG
jgi:thiol-disulfide isomerase/thioredoxin